MNDPKAHFEAALARALAALAQEPLADEAIHAARKDLKRARAALRLLRDAVPRAAYAAENARLRDAARPLAPLRDRGARLETIESLLREESAPRCRASLRGLKAEAGRRDGTQRAPRRVIQRVQEAAKRVGRWRVPLDRSAVLRAGLERIYRSGRKAFRAAQERGTDARLHEARKQAKYLWHALEIALPRPGPKAARATRRARKVSEWLGDDQDLALVQQRARREDLLRARLSRRRSTLQKKALREAGRLYKPAPRRFVKRVLP